MFLLTEGLPQIYNKLGEFFPQSSNEERPGRPHTLQPIDQSLMLYISYKYEEE